MSDVVTSEVVSKKITNLLSKNRGVFIGETHDEFLAANFMTSHMAELKKAGVTTLYIEYNAFKTRASQGGEDCRAEFMGKSKNDDINELMHGANSFQDVIDAASLAGIRVIGHDPLTGTSWQWEKILSDRSVEKKLLTGGAAVDYRDDFAARLINDTYDGHKFIVYGGDAHSGNDIADRPSHKGISERLNIPSIDFTQNKDFYYSRESDLAKLVEKPFANGQQLHMRPGVSGESTYKVYGASEQLGMPANADNIFAGLDPSKLTGLQQGYAASGVCKLPKNLVHQDFVSLGDVENLVKHLDAPANNKAGRVPK